MLNPSDIARMIDHSILHPTFTDLDLERECKVAIDFEVATVCVKPYHVLMAAQLVDQSPVDVCAVIGFPHGNSTTAIKIAETLSVIKDGAVEVDMVINIGKALQKDWKYVENEIMEINNLCRSNDVKLKVIFETDYLSAKEDIKTLCRICNNCEVAFVKTSTGYGFVKGSDGKYGYLGARDEDLILMREVCDDGIAIKAAGGVRTLEDVLRVRKLGVTRVGATATKSIMEEASIRFGK